MTRTAWFHAFSGIAGDMALGSLLDAGAPVDDVREMLSSLPFDGWVLHAEPVLRGGIAGTNVTVEVTDTESHRTATTICKMIAESALPDRVKQRSTDVFTALATAEAALHNATIDKVHFHEVGGHDAIVDVVGTIAALELLGIDEIVVSPVAVGMGMVASAHGQIPNPAPATVKLLVGLETRGVDLGLELTTPTGAALLTGLGATSGPLPEMTLLASGFGAGDADLAVQPNLLQVVVGDVLADG